ncbi:MAG TPA: hypothetical protein VN132_11400, partial [Bdellovibrio sp.]|nr:hypothetical protein [Bdellovibrio sp.]
MKNFLAVFTGSPTHPAHQKWEALDAETRKNREYEGMKAWGDWVSKNQNRIVEMGGPLGRTKRVEPKGISDIRNQMAAYTVVKAESHEEAAQLFLNH